LARLELRVAPAGRTVRMRCSGSESKWRSRLLLLRHSAYSGNSARIWLAGPLQTRGKTTRKVRMRTASEVISLDDLGIVRARGADAVRFLQGQLSNDVTRLGAGNSLLAGYHNPQGRAIALLRLVQWETDDILAVVTRELAPMVA